MLSLIYKIGGDLNPFRSAMKQMPEEAKKAGKETGNSFGKEMGQQAKSVLMQFIGGGAIVGLFRQAFQDAENIARDRAKTGLGSKEVQALAKASEMTGISQEDLLAKGKANPAAFVALMKDVEAKGVFYDDRSLGSFERASSATKEFGGALKWLAGKMWSAGETGLESSYYGAHAAAGAVASKIAQATGSKRMEQAGRYLGAVAEAGAESMVGLDQGTGQALLESSRRVEQAIRALHQTTTDKL